MKKMTNWLVNIISIQGVQDDAGNERGEQTPNPRLRASEERAPERPSQRSYSLRDYPALLVENRQSRKRDDWQL